MLRLDEIPAKLRGTGLFCCWRYEERGGKRTKVPYNPKTGGRAQSTNPDTFAPLSSALDALKRSGYDGIGVGIFGNLGAIDIDHCIDSDGVISDTALDIMRTMDAYTEKSPSGQGIRILFTVPEGFQYDKGRYYINNQKLGLEIYIAGQTNKYVTVTGDALTPGRDLLERGQSSTLQTILEKYMVRPAARTPAPRASQLPVSAPAPLLLLDDQALIRKAQQAKGGGVFSELWAGGLAGYKSHSEADIALCNALAWWTNGDMERVDRLFRQSGLMRKKWDRPQSGSTYGAITVRSAIASCQGGYDPRSRSLERVRTLPPKVGDRTLTDLHPEHSARYGWHDIGNGNLFADCYKDSARYVPERKKWYFFTGKAWEPDTGNLKVMEMCKQQADALNGYALSIEDERQRNAYLGHVKKWQVRRNRETILKDAASVYPVHMSEFDRDRYLFNCQNGTLDLRTFEFRPHSPSDMLATISGVIFDPEAKAELWERVVWDAMQGDADKVAFLQKSMGYGLTGDTSEECFFLLYGATTRNAKGTVMETYMKMLGGYGRTAKPETIAQRQTPNSNGPSEDIARLAGARVVNISEPGKQMVLSASLVKTLTGNDTVTARFLNENSFEYKPQFKLFVNTNHLPKVTDVTVFSSGRVKVIPFERHFTEAEQDKTLKRRLARAENLSGLLNWCLDGLRLMRETGFEPPAAVMEATSQYQRDSDKIARFVDEMMEPDVHGEIRTEDAYKAYQEWCDRNGQKAEGMPTFKQSMGAFAEVKRKRPAGTGREATKQTFFLGQKWR